MYYLFTVTENTFSNDVYLFEKFSNKSLAFKKLRNLIDILSKKENANLTQPTMNDKDRFHIYVDGKVKRTFIVIRGVKNNEYSAKLECLMKVTGSMNYD